MTKKSVTGKVVIECDYTFLSGTITEHMTTHVKSKNSQSNSETWNNSAGVSVAATTFTLPVEGKVALESAWAGSTNDTSSQSDDKLTSKQDTHISPVGLGYHIRTITTKIQYDIEKSHFGYDVVNKEKTYLRMLKNDDGMKLDHEKEAIEYMQKKYGDVTITSPRKEFVIVPKLKEWENLRKILKDGSQWYIRTMDEKPRYLFFPLLKSGEKQGFIESEIGNPKDGKTSTDKMSATHQGFFEIEWRGKGEDSFVYLKSGSDVEGFMGRYVYMSNIHNPLKRTYCKTDVNVPDHKKGEWIIERVANEKDSYYLIPKKFKGTSWASIDLKNGRMKKSEVEPPPRGWFKFEDTVPNDDDVKGAGDLDTAAA